MYSSLERLFFCSVLIDAEERCRRLWRIFLVKLDDCHLRLLRHISHLRETDIRLTYPSLDGMRLHRPRKHLPRLALRKNAAQHEPSVLCQHTTVVKFEHSVGAADAYHTLWSILRHKYRVTAVYRQRVDEAVCTTIVVSLESLELSWFLSVRTCNGLTCGIAWEAV